MYNTSDISIISWLKVLENIKQGEIIAIDFLKPFHLVTLGLTTPTINFLSKDAEKYAARMGLHDVIGIQCPYNLNYYSEEGKFIPIQKFIGTEDEDERYAKLKGLVTELLELRFPGNQEIKVSLYNCLLEIVNNFFDHAEAGNYPCLLAAQSWPKGNLVQIAIADTGVGIRKSLSANPSLLSRLSKGNACEVASEYGVSSKLKDHSGYGLTVAKDLMRQCGGTYMLFSGNEYFCSKYDKMDCKTNFPWKGTLLVLEWNIEVNLDIEKVYSNWPNPEGFDDDDFF